MTILGSGLSIDSTLATHVDTNVYTLSLRAGEVYDLWVAGADTPIPVMGGVTPTLLDPTLTISGPGGAQALADDDSAEGRNPVITFVAPQDGLYTVTVGEALKTAGSGGTYTLNVDNRSYELDIADHTFKADPLDPAIGPAVKGADMVLAEEDVLQSSIGVFGDHDLVAVYLTNATNYTFDMQGASTVGSVTDPVLRLLDANGVVQAVTPGAPVGTDEQFTFNPGVNGGLYYLDAASSGPLDTGSYELSFNSAIAVDVPGSTASTFNAPFFQTIRGDIEISGDSDWYAVQLVAGKVYEFDLASDGLSDPELVLRDSAGSQVTVNNDANGLDSRITFTVGVSGLYFLDAHDHSVGTGVYELTAFSAAPPRPVLSVTSEQGASEPETVTDGRGAESVVGGAGDDTMTISVQGPDTFDGGAGNDTIVGGGGLNSLVGGQGNDVLQGPNDSMSGGNGNDTMTGTAGNNLMDGGGDADSMHGGADSDTMTGGDGNDTIDGGGGGDHLSGGAGVDIFNDVQFGDIVSGGTGIDTVNALIPYTLPGDVEDLNLIIGAGNINGNGNGNANVIFGNDGNNTLQGLVGNDTVSGGAGNDTLIGGAGKDLNTGGGGLDHIKFNALSDSGTVFANRDAINTFAHGDKIDLSAIDANTTIGGNQAFTFHQNFTHHAGEVQFDQIAANSFLVQADVNGDGVSDFSINLYTAPVFGTLQGFDFIL